MHNRSAASKKEKEHGSELEETQQVLQSTPGAPLERGGGIRTFRNWTMCRKGRGRKGKLVRKKSTSRWQSSREEEEERKCDLFK